MSRRKLIAANWKMYKTPAEAKAFVDAFLPLIAGHTRDEIALFPSPVLLPTVTAACNASNVAVGCQNIHFAEEGAYTGETSVGQLIAVGGTHTLIGHSERRQYFAETDEIVNKKLHTALKHGIVPIVCIGELLAEREAGKTASVLKTQVTGAFAGITAVAAAPIVIAYEPSVPAKPQPPRWRWTRTKSYAPKWQKCSVPLSLRIFESSMEAASSLRTPLPCSARKRLTALSSAAPASSPTPSPPS
jgi:triosephosphate isomerase